MLNDWSYPSSIVRVLLGGGRARAAGPAARRGRCPASGQGGDLDIDRVLGHLHVRGRHEHTRLRVYCSGAAGLVLSRTVPESRVSDAVHTRRTPTTVLATSCALPALRKRVTRACPFLPHAQQPLLNPRQGGGWPGQCSTGLAPYPSNC